jgi:hypothetical protein
MTITQMSGAINGGKVVKMAKESKPKLVQLFENMLWANSPKDWVLKSVYSKGTLFISMLIEMPYNSNKKIRRSFSLDIITSRMSDLCGLAEDCVDEMKRELK